MLVHTHMLAKLILTIVHTWQNQRWMPAGSDLPVLNSHKKPHLYFYTNGVVNQIRLWARRAPVVFLSRTMLSTAAVILVCLYMCETVSQVCLCVCAVYVYYCSSGVCIGIRVRRISAEICLH